MTVVTYRRKVKATLPVALIASERNVGPVEFLPGDAMVEGRRRPLAVTAVTARVQALEGYVNVTITAPCFLVEPA